MFAPAMFERELLRKALDRRIHEANALAGAIRVAADGNDAQIALARGVDHLLRAIMIRRDHGGTASHDEIAEQPQLGVEIVRDIRMIIHVVARQVGKTAGRDAYAVKPELVEAVR